MKSENTKYSSVDEYIESFSGKVALRLRKIRMLIKKLVPEATESISYNIPTFDLNGKHLVHFAGYKNHIGFYPTPSGIDKFSDEIEKYKRGKGSLQFPLTEVLPEDFITKVVEFRENEIRLR